MEDRQKEIHDKGFNMGHTQFNSMKTGRGTLQDAVLDLGSLKALDRNYGNKSIVLQALMKRDLPALREISKYFYRTSGIYYRACNYLAQMYRYDWYIVPEIYDNKTAPTKIVGEFNKVLNYLDNSHIKKTCGDIALEVIKEGAYYGYVVEGKEGIFLQQLPISYCRTRYSVGGHPAVEFNMKFFDEKFADVGYRMRVIKMFPDEFAKAYVLYKQGKLGPDYNGDEAGSWYLLDPDLTIKFSLNNGDVPLLANAIPAILDLDAAQDLDRRKQMQKLLKIIVQTLPVDKNGDLLFDIDEARDIHNNAVEMLSRAIGVDVLTTFTDVEAINISDSNTTTSTDDLAKVERSVFNSLGVSQNLFNTDGNLSLEKSILNDEGSVRTLLLQFGMFYDRITQLQSPAAKKYKFRLYMLETTQYNYKDLSKLYKEQVQIGYSKMLPQIALGHSQSFILNSCYFENEVLKLHEIMIPPLMSSTMSSEDVLGRMDKKGTGETQDKKTAGAAPTEKSAGGRPEKPEGEKSAKTLANKESMN